MNKPGLPTASNFIRQIVEADLASGKYKAVVQQDVQAGSEAGVNATPTFFINGVRYDGSWEREALLAALTQANA